MATLKQRLHRKNASGTYDTIYMETSADMVLMTDGTTKLSSKISTMDTTIAGKANSSHTHMDTQITAHDGVVTDTLRNIIAHRTVKAIPIGTYTAEILNNPAYQYSYVTCISNTVAQAIGLPNDWYHVMYWSYAPATTGHGCQIAISMHGNDMRIRASNQKNWAAWAVIYHTGNLNPTAYAPSNLIVYGTGDMVAGSSALGTGHIYCVYE